MFIIDLEYTGSMEEIDAHLVAHRNFLDLNYQKGLLLASGPKNPRVGGVILALGSNRKLIEDMIEMDPFFQKDLARYTITEFNPVKHRAEIGNLISL